MSKQYPGGIISKTPVIPSGPYETSTASGIWTLDQQAYWRKLNQWPIAGSVQPDPQFNYVTMLLHGDGTNGAQNNTFLDSSTNNFTITRNGNTTQGSFSPYGSNWSNYFDGNGDYLSIPDNSALEGFTNFTFECWLYVSDFASGDIVFAKGFGPGFCPYMFYFTSTDLVFYASSSLSSWDVADSQVIVSNIVKNQWYHVAASRSGSSIKLFANGAVTTSLTNGSTIGTNATTFNVASAVDGTRNPEIYISNLRINNTALYTAAFTPSTTPLTAVSGTALLTCQSNRYIDNSANAFAITVNGTPSVQRFNPFGTSTAYSTSVIGGSGYFDGTGDYLACGSQSAYAFGTGDFTINVWVYLTAAPTYMSIADTRNSGWALAIDAARSVYLYSSIGEFFVVQSSNGAVPLTAWTYITVKRVSGTMTLYVNAVSVASASNSNNFTNTTLAVGANTSGGEPIFGYICDFQAIKGTGTTPTLPTAPLTNVANTSLLLNFQNGAIFDNAMMNDLETVGNAQISTSVVKYGTGSLAFDGTGDRLDGPATVNMAFGTGDYTIEFWCYPSNTGYGCFIDTRSANPSTNGVSIFNNGTALEIYGQGAILTASGVFTLNTWQFFALTRSGTSLKAFVNGTQVGSTVTNSDNQTAGRVKIGDNVENLYPLNGYIDDLRITKGYARYTANFTPPTAAFPNFGPT